MGDNDLIHEELDVLQSDIDDESPQVLGVLIERLLAEGVLDAHLTSLHMKRNRPGLRVEVLCHPTDRERFIRLLLAETSTLGVKARRVERYSLPRRFEEIQVRGKPIRIKVALLDGAPLRAVPEFSECQALAESLRLPVRQVLDEARAECAAWIARQRTS